MNNISFIKKQFISYIDKIIENDKISHCYLFEVDDFDKDLFFIKSFIKMILCHKSYEEVCNSNDPIILQIDSNNYPDIKVIEPDGNFIKKSQLMSLQKEYQNTSLLDNKRIYIILHAECLNSSSANTILKFIEEPEDDIIAFLVTDNRYHVIDTVLSRCQVLTIKENAFSFYNDDLCEIVLNCFVSPTNFFIQYNYLYQNIFTDKSCTIDILKNIEKVLVSYINSRYVNDYILDKKYSNILEKIPQNKILLILNVIESEILRLNYNVNFKLWLDSFYSKIILGG